MTPKSELVASLRGFAGGLIGGAVGFALFMGLARAGYFAIVLPAALLGLGWGMLSRHWSLVDGAICGLLGLAVTLYCDWHLLPRVENASFEFYLRHIFDLSPYKLGLLLFGPVAAAWFGAGRPSRVTRDE